MSQFDAIRKRAASLNKRILLPEAEQDIRVLQAAVRLYNGKLGQPILFGNLEKIRLLGEKHGLVLPEEIGVIPVNSPETEKEKVLFFEEKLSHKKPDQNELKAVCNDALYTAGWMLATGRGDAAVAGSVASTSDVIRAALLAVGVAEGSSLVSSTFLMEMPDGQVLSYADCGVVPVPDPAQLASIAIATATTHQQLTGEEPYIAFLSFSTLGSSRHERAEWVRQAVAITKEKQPGWNIDGELQFDAAFVPEVAMRKAPRSPVAGRANIFIFPNLDAANIAYKITERLAGANATGPILQGLAKPFMDLSRGCSVGDIVNVACAGQLLSIESAGS